MPNGEKSTRQDRQSDTERSARATQRLSVLGEMTGGVAHDFRNILTIIDTGLRRAENNSTDPRAARTFIAGAREGVDRGLMLTSQLLTFAKHQEFQVGAADVNGLLTALKIFLRYGAGSEVRVVVELSPNIPNCLIDPAQFNAAILNLVINARDAMPKGGEIRISTALWVVETDASDASPANYVRVRVTDNGLGNVRRGT